jgi:RNA polymerase sigma factor (TIGR02999 family)
LADATVTELLRQLSMGQQSAEDKLLPLVYSELKRMAHRQLKSERPGHTLNTTALVHEAYLRLGLERISWQDRAHFFAVAARAMRRVLIDYAEARRAEKRSGGAAHVALDETVAAPERRVDDLLALDEALNRLAQKDPRQVSVVECHVFAGMSLEDTATALGISPATVSRDWALARAWLNRALNQDKRIVADGAAL